MSQKTVPPCPGTCPYCGGELAPGFIKAAQSAGLYFTSGSPDTIVNAAESLGLCSMGDGAITLDCSHVFRRTQTAPAAVCRACHKIIIDYGS